MKKNHYKLMERFYISAALVLLMAVSCSKSGQGDYYSDPDAVHFSAVVGSGTKTSPVGSAEEQTKQWRSGCNQRRRRLLQLQSELKRRMDSC